MSTRHDRESLAHTAAVHGWIAYRNGDTDTYRKRGRPAIGVDFAVTGHACGGLIDGSLVHADEDVAQWAESHLADGEVEL